MKFKFLKIFNLLLIVILSLSLAGCSGQTSKVDSQKEDEVIKLGTLATIEPFTTVLKEELVAKGYNVEVVMFDANNMPAIATKDGDINGFIHNHLPWIEIFNKENNSNLVMLDPYLCYYRTAMYSSKYKTLEELPDGAQIAIANDPTNIDKTLQWFQELGLLTLGEKTENFYTILDIKDNSKNIKFIETEITTTARSIDDADAVVCPATRIKAAGVDPNSFIVEDQTTKNFPVGLTVDEASKDKQWVKDAMEILASSETKAKFDEIFGGTLVLYN